MNQAREGCCFPQSSSTHLKFWNLRSLLLWSSLTIPISVISCGRLETGPVGGDRLSIFIRITGTSLIDRTDLGSVNRLETFVPPFDRFGPLGVGRVWYDYSETGDYRVHRDLTLDRLTVNVDCAVADGIKGNLLVVHGLTEERKTRTFTASLGEVVLKEIDITCQNGDTVELELRFDQTKCHRLFAAVDAQACYAHHHNGVGGDGFLFSDCFAAVFLAPTFIGDKYWEAVLTSDTSILTTIGSDSRVNMCNLEVHKWDKNSVLSHKHERLWFPLP